MIAALDANVLASAAVRSQRLAPPAAIWDIWNAHQAFTLVVSQHVVDEVERTLRKPYFASRLGPVEVATFLSTLHTALMTPIAAQTTGVATHPEDDLVLATALSANADYLVTGDLKLQALGAYQGVTILSPRAFLDVLMEQGYQP